MAYSQMAKATQMTKVSEGSNALSYDRGQMTGLSKPLCVVSRDTYQNSFEESAF